MSESYSARRPKRQTSTAVVAGLPDQPTEAAAPDRPKRRPWLMLIPVFLGVALYSLVYVLRFAPDMLPKKAVMPAMMGAMFGPMLAVLLLALAWLIFGSASRLTRIASTVLLAALAAGAFVLADNDTRFWFTIWGIPAAVGVLTVALVLLLPASAAVRVGLASLLALAALAPWELVRMEGVTGDFGMNPVWRWSPTAEQRVARFTEEEDSRPGQDVGRVEPLPVRVSEDDWPGFRGANRDGRAPALHSHELAEVWRRPVGPGWGSVCGVGDWLFTQEQFEDSELVVCYDLKTGKRLWRHAEKARHSDGPGGPGPRATPTFHDGKLYVQGATGLVTCLDAVTGKPEWTTDLKEVLDLKEAVFGFAGSPLVLGGKVYVHPGVKGPLLVALDAKTGKKVWQVGEQENESYSSPQRATLAGVEQVLVFGADGLSGHDPETGKELWRYEWVADPTAQPCVQPTLLGGDRVVVGGAQPGTGLRCVKVTKTKDAWAAEELWQTTKVTPRFNDVVVYDGNLYGLDGGTLFCVNADDGEVRWKGGRGRYGAGQVLLVGDRLLVLSEKGQLHWFDADPKAYPTPTQQPALKHKTWNHPALVRGQVIVRNSTEMVCFGTK